PQPVRRARRYKLLTGPHCSAEMRKRQADSWRKRQVNRPEKPGFCHLFAIRILYLHFPAR
ncbi:hypothetical protein, partial [Serratia marcescens]|uniref:hypothetical protein n=1 Tax=Serratia marcescens TaxID=615 RepID=UPI00237FED32